MLHICLGTPIEATTPFAPGMSPCSSRSPRLVSRVWIKTLVEVASPRNIPELTNIGFIVKALADLRSVGVLQIAPLDHENVDAVFTGSIHACVP